MRRIFQLLTCALAIGVMASWIVGCDDEEGDADADADADGDGDGDGDVDADGDGDTDADSDGDSDGDADSDGDGDGDGDGDVDGDGDGGGGHEDECSDACGMFVGCTDTYDDESACVDDCTEEYSHFNETAYGMECVNGLTAFYTCWSGLSCADLTAYYSRTTDPFPCASEESQLSSTCFPDADASVRDSCREGCAKSSECYSSARTIGVGGCLNACVLRLSRAADDGADCMAAVIAGRTCGHALSCADYTEWLNHEAGNPCATEDAAVAAACPTFNY